MITLRTLPRATAQEVFNQSAKHILTQARRSVDKSGFCQYKDGQGLSCAAGCFIGKSEYRKKFEGDGWRNLASMGSVPVEHQELIVALQRVHDDCNPEWWVERLKWVAEAYSLNYDCIKPFEV